MFAKKYRLPAHIKLLSYSAIPLFTLRFGENGLLYNRYGFVVSKAVDKRATMRNALKRKMRAFLEINHKKLKQGYDLLFIGRVKAKEVQTKELWLAIEHMLKEKNLL